VVVHGLRRFQLAICTPKRSLTEDLIANNPSGGPGTEIRAGHRGAAFRLRRQAIQNPGLNPKLTEADDWTEVDVEGMLMRAPVVSRKTRIFATCCAVPFVILSIVGVVLFGLPALGGVAFWMGLVVAPITFAVWMGRRAGQVTDRKLRRRERDVPECPSGFVGTEDPSFDPSSIPLPLFSRPLANLWSRVLIGHFEGIQLRLFELVHADLLGEGSVSRSSSVTRGAGLGDGLSVVTCALAAVPADIPLVVVRPRHEKPFSLPDNLQESDTDLDRFNRDFRLFSAEAYAATAIVDQRTIEAIHGFEPGTAIEIGGGYVLVYSSRPHSSARVLEQAARLSSTFPRVAASIYPAGVSGQGRSES